MTFEEVNNEKSIPTNSRGGPYKKRHLFLNVMKTVVRRRIREQVVRQKGSIRPRKKRPNSQTSIRVARIQQ